MTVEYLDLADCLAIAVATKSRAQFGATWDSPVEDFAAEADRHPVLALAGIPAAAPTGGNSPTDP